MSRPLFVRLMGGVLLATFGLVNLGNALHKGGDFDVFLAAGERVLTRQPLYHDSSPGQGVIGPPAQGLLFVPFAGLARVHATGARVVWYFLNLGALVGGAWLWTRALVDRNPGRTAAADSARIHSALGLSLLAIVLPAQTNFEHQNMNALLLGITGAGTFLLARQRDVAAGLAIGLAAALKAFPGLLLVYLAMRGRWRAATTGATLATVLTFAPALWIGPEQAWTTFHAWTEVATVGEWPTRVQNQSLFAMVARTGSPNAAAWYRALWPIAIAAVGLVAVFARRRSRPDIAMELACVLTAAVLLSPIAWDHYWVLVLPALAALRAQEFPGSRAIFWICALLVSGPAPALVGARGLAIARAWSTYTLAAGLLLIVTAGLVLIRSRERSPAQRPASASSTP